MRFSTSLSADDFPYSDFGVEIEGYFDSSGMPQDWVVSDTLSGELPTFLQKEPVIFLADTEGRVYLRGLYSHKLTEKRRQAMNMK